uniref:hypothetical protein n=1 Tax=Candidatus Avalokitesvara rifleensis TaxID=3367620 RepID=UPI004029A289
MEDPFGPFLFTGDFCKSVVFWSPATAPLGNNAVKRLLMPIDTVNGLQDLTFAEVSIKEYVKTIKTYKYLSKETR